MQARNNGSSIKQKSSESTPSQSVQWYMLGVILCLLTFTTSLRITLHLVESQDTAWHTESMVAVAPINVRHQSTVHAVHASNNGSPKKDVIHSDRLVEPSDFIYEYKPSQWDSAPIVVKDYKLIFFAIPKVACTTFKQLFRRMMNLTDWKVQGTNRMLPHNPSTNGLRYLWDYTLEEANEMMTSPNYTRAIFVREPKSRFLSAFLDKGVSQFGNFMRSKCCRQRQDCMKKSQTSEGFLQVIQTCFDPHWDPQSLRMEQKYWQYITFVGHFETLNQDGPALLKRIGAWEKYGLNGWGKYDNDTLFKSKAVHQTHVTDSSSKIWQWLTPSLERKIESYYADDYNHPLFGFHPTNLTKSFWIQGSDTIYAKGSWDGAPIVISKYKLIFFTIPRVGDLIWKQAFRRMEGLTDWNETGGPKGLPHDPAYNGLQYLYHFHPDDAEQMIKDPTWTKAIFVRNPRDRFLEAYKHLSTHPEEIQIQCCPEHPGCENQRDSIIRLLDLSLRCTSDQWKLQSHRMEPKYWDFVNFIGHMETVQEDAKRLLQQIGAWEEIGASGWGPDSKESIFTSVSSNANASTVSYTPLEASLVDEIYKDDLRNNRFRLLTTK